MPRPPKFIKIPLEAIFPLLMYYYAAVKDRKNQGEYSIDLTWESLCKSIDEQGDGITLTPKQLFHLVYNYKVANFDRRVPTSAVRAVSKEYLKNMKGLMKLFPHLFKQERDLDITMVDLEYE